METKGRLHEITRDWKTGRFRITFEIDRKIDAITEEELSGNVLRITAVKWRNKRSLDANAYFHVLCQKMAEKARASLTEIKNEEIKEHGQIDTEMNNIIMLDSIDWRRLDTIHLCPTDHTKVLDNGKLYRVYIVMRGSHTYDSAEMAHLIDGTIEDAKELGVETATPDELAKMKSLWAAKYEKHHSEK